MNQKGMSQVLALIIGASVFGMVALILITTAGGTFSDVFGGTSDSSCRQLVNTRCDINQNKGEVNVPKRCSSLSSVSEAENGGGYTASCSN